MQNPPSRMSEERLEIIEKMAHQDSLLLVIETCREIRRLQAKVADLSSELRRRRRIYGGGTGMPGESVGGY